MKQEEWIQMSEYARNCYAFCRRMQKQKSSVLLTNSEIELLSHIYLQDGQATPLHLSLATGMKLASVSRSLKSLLEKQCIMKQKDQKDERSYTIQLSKQGHQKLSISYQQLLKPYYDLKEAMGDDFFQLMEKIEMCNRMLSKMEGSE